MRSYLTNKNFALLSTVFTFITYFFDFVLDKNLFELIKDIQPDSLPLLLLPFLSVLCLFFLYIGKFKVTSIIFGVMLFPIIFTLLYIMIMLEADLIFKFIGNATYVLLLFLSAGMFFSIKAVKSSSSST